MFAAILSSLLIAQTSAAASTPDKDIAPFRNNPSRFFQTKDLQHIKLTIAGKHNFTVWVQDTEAKREEGMMFLEDQDFTEKQGMIFIFKQPEIQRFWMKNTFVPLDIAYISANGKINTALTMKEFDTTTDYSSKAPSMYVLEAKAGIFKKLGIKEGDVVRMTPLVRAKD
ncbi:MAG: DUF192 domain-containing protein [Armatimonadota bacterium]